MVAIELDDESYSILELAGHSSSVSTSKHVRTAPHGVCISAGISLKGKGVHFTHGDAVAHHAPPPVRNAQLEARMVKLRARLADREYRAMISEYGGYHEGYESVSRMLRNAAPASSIGFNLIATMATCFTAAYFLANAMTGNRSIALGLGACAIAGALAVEATLVLTRLYRIEQAEEELERKKRRRIDRQAIHHINTNTNGNTGNTAIVPKIVIPEHTAPRPAKPKAAAVDAVDAATAGIEIEMETELVSEQVKKRQ